MVIGYQASPTKTKTDILVASASCGVTVLTQQEYPHRLYTQCGAGFLIAKGKQLMTALSMLLGPVYFYMDFFNRFGYFPG